MRWQLLTDLCNLTNNQTHSILFLISIISFCLSSSAILHQLIQEVISRWTAYGTYVSNIMCRILTVCSFRPLQLCLKSQQSLSVSRLKAHYGLLSLFISVCLNLTRRICSLKKNIPLKWSRQCSMFVSGPADAADLVLMLFGLQRQSRVAFVVSTLTSRQYLQRTACTHGFTAAPLSLRKSWNCLSRQTEGQTHYSRPQQPSIWKFSNSRNNPVWNGNIYSSTVCTSVKISEKIYFLCVWSWISGVQQTHSFISDKKSYLKTSC